MDQLVKEVDANDQVVKGVDENDLVKEKKEEYIDLNDISKERKENEMGSVNIDKDKIYGEASYPIDLDLIKNPQLDFQPESTDDQSNSGFLGGLMAFFEHIPLLTNKNLQWIKYLYLFLILLLLFLLYLTYENCKQKNDEEEEYPFQPHLNDSNLSYFQSVVRRNPNDTYTL